MRRLFWLRATNAAEKFFLRKKTLPKVEEFFLLAIRADFGIM